jgi:hypothetical protein
MEQTQPEEVDKFISKYSTSASSEVVILKEELLRKYTSELVDFLLGESRKFKDFGMASTTLKQIIEVKKAFFPEAITSRNLNVNVFQNQLQDWAKIRKEIKKDENSVIIKEVEQALEEKNGTE